MIRSFLAALLVFVSSGAFAQNTLTHGTAVLFRGSTNLGTFADQAACVAAAQARVISASTTYQCRENLTVVPPAPPPAQPVVTLTANPQTVTTGDASTLSWSTTNATDCTASNGWTGTRPTAGNESTGPLTVATAYTLTCNGVGGAGSASTTVNVQAAPPPGTQFGLEWLGDGSAHRMLLWSNVVANGLPMYDATYIFRVFPKGPKTDSNPHYWTTFFWGNNGPFSWGGNACNAFYGAHPYPFSGQDSNNGQNWELSVNCNDYSFVTPNNGAQVQWNRWFTQAFRAYKVGSNYVHEFYFDLPDTSKVITFTRSGVATPPNPSVFMGQGPNVNGVSWGGYAGWEEFKGIIRGIQFYNANLSIVDILNEVTLPQSTAAGNASAWYINLNPRPSDVTDKKSGGTPHNPVWDGSQPLEWSQ